MDNSFIQSEREALPTPTGWLVAPTRDFCLFFIHDPKSVMVAPTVLTQLWYCTEEGIPTKLKILEDWIMNLSMKLGMNLYLMIGN